MASSAGTPPATSSSSTNPLPPDQLANESTFLRLMFFFFSSRRRHTRLQGDWSSDVCSSDLTLHNEFSRMELSTILPDDYRKMNLEDLAYALWLRSDLSKWRVPAVITVHDI